MSGLLIKKLNVKSLWGSFFQILPLCPFPAVCSNAKTTEPFIVSGLPEILANSVFVESQDSKYKTDEPIIGNCIIIVIRLNYYFCAKRS